jgi:hypothetical protein
MRVSDPAFINVVFDGPPDPYKPFILVEVETDDGRSLNVGKWGPHRGKNDDGWWSLRIPYRAPAEPIEIPDQFEPQDEDLHATVIRSQHGGGFHAQIVHKPTNLTGGASAPTQEAAEAQALDNLLAGARGARSRMGSLKGNPLLRQVYRHQDEPDTIWGAFTDSKGNVHRVPVHRGDALFPILLDRHEALTALVEEVRRDLGNTP